MEPDDDELLCDECGDLLDDCECDLYSDDDDEWLDEEEWNDEDEDEFESDYELDVFLEDEDA